MFWWSLFQAIQVIAYLVAIGIAVYWIVTDLWPNVIRPVSKKAEQTGKLRATGRVIHTEETSPVRFGAGDPLNPTSADEARAGQVISDVPNYNPTASKSWQQDRTVVATAMAQIYTPQGISDTVFIWTSGDMLLMKTPKKWRLLTELRLTSHEAQRLLDERLELLNSVKHNEPPNVAINDFRGCNWNINGAYGRNEGGSNPGQSTIECTSMLTDLGEFKDDVPSLTMKRNRPVNYFDLRADWISGDPGFKDRTFVAIWAEEGSDCVLYVGRDLTQAEIDQMQVT